MLLTYRNTGVPLPPASATSPAAAVRGQGILPAPSSHIQSTAGARPWCLACLAHAAVKTNSEGADASHVPVATVATNARKEEAGR